MKLKFLSLLFIPLLLLSGCQKKENTNYASHEVTITRTTGEISNFNLLKPDNGFTTAYGFTFTWEAANKADYYQLEIASTATFITDDEDEVYMKQNNISENKFDLSFTLPKKDIQYYWRVTAVNKDHTKPCNDEYKTFFYESVKGGELPIEIEDPEDWVLHKEGAYADISVDRNNFFGNNKNALAIVFDKEHTSVDDPKRRGWIVVTKTEDRELYGTDAFYLNFYYSGHDSTVLIRVLDNDGEYWHKQVQISNNSKQTILMKYDDFELRTAGGNVFNRVFDWWHIRYFEIVFERTFGDGVCLVSDIKGVQYDQYKHLFMDKMDFRCTDPKDWTYENFDFEKTISEDGSEITLGYQAKSPENPNGFSGYGFQNINLYKFFVTGDALRMKVKYTGTGANAMFYFRVLEEDMDRWQFKTPFSYFTKDEYKELIIPLKAFQRTDYMNGDGAKQFYFVQKFNVGLADNYSSGTISIKDLEVIKLADVIPSNKRVVGSDGMIEDFNDYNIYTEIYYYWEQSVVNKDEAMKLDTTHKAGGASNTYCAEFDYKADMEQAVYQLYMDTTAVVGKSAFSLWLKDASVKFEDPAVAYLPDEDVAAEMTIQLTLDTGEWYRYTIDKVLKTWNNYTIAFKDFELFNQADLIDPQPLLSEHIIHIAFGFKYLYYDQQGNHHPTYAIANPVYLDEICFTNDTASSIVSLDSEIKEDTDNPNRITVDTFEKYTKDDDLFEYWSYGSTKEYNNISLSDEVSSQGDDKSLKMHYKGSDSVSYVRNTPFSSTVTAKGLCIDIKGDGKATLYINLNARFGSTTFKMRYSVKNIPTTWTHYEIGFDFFKDVNGSSKVLASSDVKNFESISFGIVNGDYSASDIYIDNLRLLKNIGYDTYTVTAID